MQATAPHGYSRLSNVVTPARIAIELNKYQVATSRMARDINRRIVLNLIRKHQPISRADIARCSRLQRSTVSAITEQLISERWVTTGSFGDQSRGRKPKLLHLNEDREGFIGIDIRPEETRLVLANSGMRFLSEESMPTGDDSGQFITGLCERLQKLRKTDPRIEYEGIGLTVPGHIEWHCHQSTCSSKRDWNFVDFKKSIEQAMGLPVELENAANACAVAETWGDLHLEGIQNLIVVTVSEDIGVGMILNGQLIRGSNGMAGQFGHVTIQEDGPLCTCGNRGCFQACASNTAAVRYFTESCNQTGCNPPTIEPNFEVLLKMSADGNHYANASLDRMAHFLGIGLALMITGLTPDVIVIVGEVTRAWGRVSPIINDIVKRRLPTGARTRILPGASGIHSRMRCPVALVLQRRFGLINYI